MSRFEEHLLTWWGKLWETPRLHIFLDQLIKFYSNNTTDLRHSTPHSTPRCPTT